MRRLLSLASAACIVLTLFLALVLSGWGRQADVAGGNGVPDVRMDQTSYSAAVGGTFHVLINVTGLGVVNCSHYQFGLTYDNTLVNIIASTPDEETGCVCGLYKRGFSWYYGDPLYGAGVDCGEVGVGTPTPASPPFTDPQQMVDFTFQCLRDGNGLLAFGDIVLYDGAGNPAYVVNTGADVLCGAGEPTSTSTWTPVSTETPTRTPVATDTPMPTPNPTATGTLTPTPTTPPTSTVTPDNTSTPIVTPTPVSTIHHRPTRTPVATDTPVPPSATPMVVVTPLVPTPALPLVAPTPMGGAGPAITAPSTGGGRSNHSPRWLPATWLLLAAGSALAAAGVIRQRTVRR